LRKTALIVRPGALGDTILTLPLLESVAKQHPDAALTLLGNRSYLELFSPGITVQSIDSPEWLWLFSNEALPAGVSAPVFDIAYVILNSGDKVVSNLRRAGTRSVLWTSSRPRPMEHVVEHFHEGLGLPAPPRKPALAHLARAGREDLIWIHPGSGGPSKCLPLNFFTRIAEALANSTGLDLAITVSEQDAFLRDLPGWMELVNRPGTTLFEDRPLTELCSKLGAARLFIGNDSGIGHLAAGLGIPSVVMFVATDPVQWMPWVPRENLHVLDLRDEIPVPDLLSARVHEFLSGPPSNMLQ